MKIGERIRELRKERGLSLAYVANALGVSASTVYRYEESHIEKLPVNVFDKLCELFGVTPAVLMGNSLETETQTEATPLPEQFYDAQEAMQWVLRIPSLATFGEYNVDSMSEETIVDFANEILQQLKLVSYKYKR